MEPLNEQCFIQTLLVNIVLIALIHGGSMAFSCFFFTLFLFSSVPLVSRDIFLLFWNNTIEQAFIEFLNKTLDD